MNDVGMLASPSNRSRIYLAALAEADLRPSTILYLDSGSEKNAEQKRRQAEGEKGRLELPEEAEGLEMSLAPIPELADRLGIPLRRIPDRNPNSPRVVVEIAEVKQSVMIYSGPGGVILRRPLLTAGPRFLHVHAGRLPDYRGSTTVYYSLLREGTCGATAFFLEEDLDRGPIVAGAEFPPPKDRRSIDLFYDPWIRAQVLVEVLRGYRAEGTFRTRTQAPTGGEMYYIIHPVLKHAAIFGSRPLDATIPGGPSRP